MSDVEQIKRVNQSIHPRVVNGRTKHKKVNTMKHSNGAAKARAIAGISLHLENHPNDGQSKTHLAKLIA